MDTWEWNGSNWILRATSGPGPTYNGASDQMVFDEARRVMVFFSGFNTWEWNGATWTLRTVTNPSRRDDYALAYDSNRGVSVLFGGSYTRFNEDTWEWNGQSWTLRAASGPPPRDNPGMTFDRLRGVVVMSGGYRYYDDTWEWDGNTWREITSSHPSPRYSHSMVYDTRRGAVVSFGGNTAAASRDDYHARMEEYFHDCNNNGTLDESEFALHGDCNRNGIVDTCDIAAGTALDANTNGVIDSCLVAAVSRKGCDLPLDFSRFGRTSEPRQGGITEICVTSDNTALSAGVTIEEIATCTPPFVFVPYGGASIANCGPGGDTLCCTFSPGLENGRRYRLTFTTTAGPTQVEIRALFGDVNSDGRADAVDRSLVVGAWTSPVGNCETDLDNNGLTNSVDRSLAVGAWTGTQNCAP